MLNFYRERIVQSTLNQCPDCIQNPHDHNGNGLNLLPIFSTDALTTIASFYSVGVYIQSSKDTCSVCYRNLRIVLLSQIKLFLPLYGKAVNRGTVKLTHVYRQKKE